jgi:hypothetical protein
MAGAFRADDWKDVRKYIYWPLQDADGKITLPLGDRPPRSANDIHFMVQGWEFEFRLDETLRLTAEALKDASGALTEAHRVAAAVRIAAPTTAKAAELTRDLRSLSRFVQHDQRARALSSFFAGAAEAIDGMTTA